MPQFVKLAEGLPVAPVLAELDARPDLWDANPERRVASGSPHADMNDIWVRWRDPTELREPADYAAPHFPVFWPAWHALPSFQPIVRHFMAHGVTPRGRPTHLGGILLTRLPPGGSIKPHSDRGAWHAEVHDFKVFVTLAANAECVNYCAGESVVMAPGEAWTFDNLLPHSVVNGGATERIVGIISMRTE